MADSRTRFRLEQDFWRWDGLPIWTRLRDSAAQAFLTKGRSIFRQPATDGHLCSQRLLFRAMGFTDEDLCVIVTQSARKEAEAEFDFDIAPRTVIL